MLEIKAIVVELSEEDAKAHTVLRGRDVPRFTAMCNAIWVGRTLMAGGNSREEALHALSRKVSASMMFSSSITEHMLHIPQPGWLVPPAGSTVEELESLVAELGGVKS